MSVWHMFITFPMKKKIEIASTYDGLIDLSIFIILKIKLFVLQFKTVIGFIVIRDSVFIIYTKMII